MIYLNLGMTDCFSNKSNFSNITKQEQLLIQAIRHKTYIKIDEYGTTATSATIISMGAKGITPNIKYKYPSTF